MRSSLDPSAVRTLQLIKESGRPTYESLSPEGARRLVRESRGVVAPDPPDVAAVTDLTAPGPGGPIKLRLYRGMGLQVAPAPVLIYFHGGGWVFGDLETHDVVCRTLANGGPFAVVAVDYRLAPEHRFPAAVEDADAAVRWIGAQAAPLGIDPARLAIGGDSAGGNLAAVVSLLARGRGPALAAQMLFYPVTDLGRLHPSYDAFVEGFPVTRATMLWFRDLYLRSEADRVDWRASPLRAPDLRGLPPSFVMTAGFDPLRDEGKAYAERLRASGVAVTERAMDGQIHGFVTMGRLIPEATMLLDEATAWLRARLGVAGKA
jgi:acetyl esterase